jgi:hypothetical protein
VGSLLIIGTAKGIEHETFAHAARSLAHHTTKMGGPTLAHFEAEIMLIAFLNQGCERPSSGFNFLAFKL